VVVDRLQIRAQLTPQHRLRLVGVPLRLGLAHAEDRLEARLQRGGNLARQGLVGLAEELAPLGMPEDHSPHPYLPQHHR
jgi:hypothetical protein